MSARRTAAPRPAPRTDAIAPRRSATFRRFLASVTNKNALSRDEQGLMQQASATCVSRRDCQEICISGLVTPEFILENFGRLCARRKPKQLLIALDFTDADVSLMTDALFYTALHAAGHYIGDRRFHVFVVREDQLDLMMKLAERLAWDRAWHRCCYALADAKEWVEEMTSNGAQP